jgi:hypothetical protein
VQVDISYLVDFFENCGYKVSSIFVRNDIDEAKKRQGIKVFAIQFNCLRDAEDFCKYIQSHRFQLGSYGIFKLNGHRHMTNVFFS